MHLGRRRRIVAAVLGLALATGLTACGDDEESADVSAACDAQASVVTGFNTLFASVPEPPEDGPPPPEFAGQLQAAYDANVAVPLTALVANAPDEIKDEVEEVALKSKQFRDDADPSAIDNDEFFSLTTTIDAYMQENCSGTKVQVEASNYEYEDLPATLPAGTVRFALENTSDEAHEIVVLTRKPGVTETFDQILALPEDQLEAKFDFVAAGTADPGETGYLVTNVPVGDYIFLCSYGEGTTDDDEPSDGAPHYTLGMKQEVKVT